MAEKKRALGMGEKIDIMFDAMFMNKDSMMIRLDRIENKLDNECPVGRDNKNKICGLAWAGGIVTSAIFSVIGFFHWWSPKP